MKKRHATDDVTPVTHTLCGDPLSDTRMRGPIVDNAMPDCKRCLRIIGSRIRVAESKLPSETSLPNDGASR